MLNDQIIKATLAALRVRAVYLRTSGELPAQAQTIAEAIALFERAERGAIIVTTKEG